MKTLRYVVLALIVSAALSLPMWAQGKGGGRGRTEHHAAPAVQQDTATTSPGTASRPAVYRHHEHHGTAHHQTVSKTMPARSNKGGEVRGKARAEEVHGMNQEKHAAQKETTAHGKARGKGKK